jgi:hypothetical protein
MPTKRGANPERAQSPSPRSGLVQQADAPNAAMTSLFQGRHHWRGIGDPDRSAQFRATVVDLFGLM